MRILALLALVTLVQGVQWTNMQASEISQMSLLEIMASSAESLQVLPPTACAGFSKYQLRALSESDPETCKGFSLECLLNIQSDALVGLTSRCVEVMGEVAKTLPETQRMYLAADELGVALKRTPGSSTHNTAPSSPEASSLSVSAIIGICVGCGIVLMLIIGFIIYRKWAGKRVLGGWRSEYSTVA
eukprot:Colp12_sorted_trinity150504_noHs@26504